MSETNIVTDVLDVFRAAGFEVRESRFGPTPETIIYGTADNAGVLMESVLEHFGKATEGADSCAQREKCEVKNRAHAGATAEPASHTQFEIDKAWDKAIEAEGKSARLRSENARLIAALKDIVENPTRCVTIADAAIIASADSAE